MTEAIGEYKPLTFSRRDFLTGKPFFPKPPIVKGAIAASAGLMLVNEAIKGVQKEIRTDTGTFTPLYERHDVGIDITDIPQKIDVYFREVTTSPQSPIQILQSDIGSIIGRKKTIVYETSNIESTTEAFPIDVLDRISSSGAELMIADVNVANFGDIKVVLALELLYGGSGFAFVLDGLIETVLSKMHAKISRRKFNVVIGKLIALWGTSRALSKMLEIVGQKDEKQTALKRISARIAGITSQYHPEYAIIFFRNAIIANNLLEVAKQMKSEKNVIPKLAFQIEGAHSGIEDLLQLGQEFCKKIILAHPNDFLEAVANSNGGIEALCTSRLFKLPTDQLHFEENGEVSQTDVQKIRERRIVDQELLNKLEDLLSIT